MYAIVQTTLSFYHTNIFDSFLLQLRKETKFHVFSHDTDKLEVQKNFCSPTQNSINLPIADSTCLATAF